MSSETNKEFTLTRIFDAPVEEVWDAWVEPETIKQWYAPDGFTCPIAEMNVHVGGASILCMRAPQEFGGQDMYSRWDYVALDPPARMEYIHHLTDAQGAEIDPAQAGMPPDFPQGVRNIITLRPIVDGKTEMSITEQGYTSEQWINMSRMGLEQCLNKLQGVLAQRRNG